MKADCQNITTAKTQEITSDKVEDVSMIPILSELATH
jgi:hypothetical protein